MEELIVTLIFISIVDIFLIIGLVFTISEYFSLELRFKKLKIKMLKKEIKEKKVELTDLIRIGTVFFLDDGKEL